ncbi:MAG: hypothetical protein RLN82_10195 [Pseudomonadales bacterium]|uniref:hypothetical protein n=1 Tax=Ekhidna sp. TaxID=2608089 RepID=UPI0032EF1F4E
MTETATISNQLPNSTDQLADQRLLGSVAVLFCKRDSVYKSLGVDCWDIDRDALKWAGGVPCVAHPPCRAWGQLAHMDKPRPGEKELAFFAIDMIRKYGGVLEHPRASKLWPAYLPMPGKFDEYGGYSICVDQSWWGHKAKKNTLLYIVGCPQRELPSIPIRFDMIEYTVSSKIKKKSGRRIKKEIPKSEREATPSDFAKWLIDVARKCGTSRTEI